MKSIEDFSTEYAQDKYLPVQTSQAVKAGANYVLDVVEDFMKHNYQITLFFYIVTLKAFSN
jgi:hypothetical protein